MSVKSILTGLGKLLHAIVTILSLWRDHKLRQQGRIEERLEQATRTIETIRRADEVDRHVAGAGLSDLEQRMRQHQRP